MSIDSVPDLPEPEGMDFSQLGAAVWRQRMIFAMIVTLATAVGFWYALTATPIFRADAVVTIKTESKGGGSALQSLASQLPSFADFGGFSVANENTRYVALTTLQSRVVIEAFIADHNLLPRLFPSAWDDTAGQWKDPQKAPTLWTAADMFKKAILKITDDKKTGIVVVAIEWKDPAEAAEWVTELIARTNQRLKDETIAESERNLAYLEEQAKSATAVELREVIFGLTESELKKLMLAKGSDQYAIKIIDPAERPSRKARPHRSFIVIGGFLIGCLLGIVAAIWRERRPAASAKAAVS